MSILLVPRTGAAPPAPLTKEVSFVTFVTMPESQSDTRDAQRRKQIVDAARVTFLQFGFAKTSMDDIAKQANISRPLVYRKFKNKEEILSAVYEDLFEGRYERVETLLASRASKRDKLLQIYEILYVEPWTQVTGTPMAAELYEACTRYDPDGTAKRERLRLKYTQAVLGAKDVAEVFMLSVEGLSGDVPTTSTLRHRIEVLVQHFT
jgi:TetR/AcrR family transcriptional regulator, transcriptional repressor of aconitase